MTKIFDQSTSSLYLNASHCFDEDVFDKKLRSFDKWFGKTVYREQHRTSEAVGILEDDECSYATNSDGELEVDVDELLMNRDGALEDLFRLPEKSNESQQMDSNRRNSLSPMDPKWNLLQTDLTSLKARQKIVTEKKGHENCFFSPKIEGKNQVDKFPLLRARKDEPSAESVNDPFLGMALLSSRRSNSKNLSSGDIFNKSEHRVHRLRNSLISKELLNPQARTSVEAGSRSHKRQQVNPRRDLLSQSEHHGGKHRKDLLSQSEHHGGARRSDLLSQSERHGRYQRSDPLSQSDHRKKYRRSSSLSRSENSKLERRRSIARRASVQRSRSLGRPSCRNSVDQSTSKLTSEEEQPNMKRSNSSKSLPRGSQSALKRTSSSKSISREIRPSVRRSGSSRSVSREFISADQSTSKLTSGDDQPNVKRSTSSKSLARGSQSALKRTSSSKSISREIRPSVRRSSSSRSVAREGMSLMKRAGSFRRGSRRNVQKADVESIAVSANNKEGNPDEPDSRCLRRPSVSRSDSSQKSRRRLSRTESNKSPRISHGTLQLYKSETPAIL